MDKRALKFALLLATLVVWTIIGVKAYEFGRRNWCKLASKLSGIDYNVLCREDKNPSAL